MKVTTSLLVAAAASLAGVNAQREHGADLLSLLQREFARSSEILEQMWDATVGRVQEDAVVEGTDTDTTSVHVVVVEVDNADNDQESLTANDKLLACRVAVKRVAEQATLREATEQLATRLRTPLRDVVSVHYTDETTCDALARPLVVEECMRVSAMAQEIEVFLRHGKTDLEVCDEVRVADEQEQAHVGPTPLSCKLCKRFVQMVDQAIAQDVAQVQVVRDILGDICDSMAADSMCHTFIKRFDDVVSWLKHGTDPDVVCARLTMCTAAQEDVLSAAALSKTAVAVTDDSHGCFYCAQISSVVGFVTQHAPDQLDTLRTVLKYVCKVTPEDCKCDEAEKNFDKIVELTKQGKAPKEVCEAIGMCKGTERSDESKLVALVSTPHAARKITTALLSFSTPYGGVRDDKKCFYCDYFTTLLQIAIQEDEKDMDDVRQYADMICGMLGDANMCHQYVDKLDFVVDELTQGKKPREICTALKFCAAKTPTPAIAANAEQLALSRRAVGKIDNCFFCTQLASIFKVALAQDESQIDQIRMVADLICKALPAENKCHMVMKQVDQVIDALKNGEEPAAVCHDLKFCPKSSPLGLVPFGDNKCVYCEYATLVLEFAVKQDEQDFDAIRMYADIICGMLGESNQCHQYVDKLDFILDSLKKGKGSHEICKALKFCASKSMAIAPPNESLAAATPVLSKAVNIDNCFFCTQLASIFKVALAQDESQIDQIRMVADLICKALPKENKCHLVMKEVDQMIDSLKRGEEPAAVCHDLNFCPKMKALDVPFALPAKSVHDHNCAYCEGAATVLELAIKTKPDQVQQVREAAGIVCDFMPEDDKCHDDLKMFDKAVADLKAGKAPHDICKELSFCKTIKKTTPLSPKAVAKLDMLDAKAISSKAEAKSMSVGCLLCEYTAEVVSHIHDNQSELRLAKKTLGTMCVVLPPMARCDTITAKFDDLVKLVGEDKKSPSEACHAISMCDAAFVEPRTISDVVAQERP